MTTDEAMARINEVDCNGKPQYPDGSVAATLATEVILLGEVLAEVKSIASYEVAVGWRNKCRAAEVEIERLREKLASRTRDAEACYQYQLDQSKTIEKLEAEIERLREKVRIESEEAMAQKARADHLELELVSVEIIASALLSKCGKMRAAGGDDDTPDTQTQGEGDEQL